jgi:hypothetical protein
LVARGVALTTSISKGEPDMKKQEDHDDGIPVLHEPNFKAMSMEESEAIRGGVKGAAGTCVGVGYACGQEGGIRLGVCIVAGAVGDNRLTDFLGIGS